MQVPSEYVSYLIGALIALAFAKFAGWLHVPFLEQGQARTVPPAPSQPVLVQQLPQQQVVPQSYSATIDIPHRITVTPEQKQ